MEKGYIVCVDDEVAVLETLREQLKKHFGETHEIEVAPSAEEGLELIEQLHEAGELIEVVISDQVMPGMKGDKFLEQVHAKFPDTIKILLTGQAGLANTIYALNHGGLNRYVEKPWNMDSLKGDIQELIDRFRQNIENQRMLRRLEARVAELEAQGSSG